MKTVAQTEYQDIYRVMDGVLLIINKFEPLYIEGVEYPRVYPVNRAGMRSYNKNCQQQLKVLKNEWHCKESWCMPAWSIPAGTVLYGSIPVVSVSDKSKWQYEIKTTGNMFSGNKVEILKMLRDIKNIVGNGE